MASSTGTQNYTERTYFFSQRYYVVENNQVQSKKPGEWSNKDLVKVDS